MNTHTKIALIIVAVLILVISGIAVYNRLPTETQLKFNNAFRDKEIVKTERRLLEHKTDPDYAFIILKQAILDDNQKIINYLFKKKWITKKTITRDRTLIYYTVENGTFDIFKLLLDFDAVLEDESADLPLIHHAYNCGKKKIIHYLVEKLDYDINTTDHDGETVLHYVTAKKNQADTIYQYLIEHGADVDAVDNSDNTPLHNAARSKNLLIVQYLIEKNCEIDPVNQMGRTPFLEAAKARDAKIVRFLAKNGADIYLHDKEDQSFIDLYGSAAYKQLPLLVGEYKLKQGGEKIIKKSEEIFKSIKEIF